MSAAFDRLFAHISKTISTPPSGTMQAYPRLNAHRFVDVDAAGGVRGELEEYLGQSRFFEISLDAISLTPLKLGGPVTASYGVTFPVRIRYDAPASNESRTMLKEITEDLTAMVDAIERSNWPSVQGVASLQAAPSSITRFTLEDEANNQHTGYIGAITIDASVDV